MDGVTFSFDVWQVVQLVVATVLPVLVGLVTTRVTSAGTKAVMLAGLALVTSLLTEALAANAANVSYDVGQGLVVALGTFVVSVATHYGLWKPTGVSAKAQATGRTANAA